MAEHQRETEDITRMFPSDLDVDETVLFQLTPDAEYRKQCFEPPVTSTQIDPGGAGDGASDVDITLTQAASRLADSASKIASLSRTKELRTSTPKRKRGPGGVGDIGGGASSSSDDRPDWQEKSTVRAKRFRKREIKNHKRKLLKDMSQLLEVMAKEEEELSSSSDDHPDWIESPYQRRRQPFKIGKQQPKEHKLVPPAVTVKSKTAEKSKKPSEIQHMPDSDSDLADYLFPAASPEKRKTTEKANSRKTAHETTVSEEEAIQQMLDATTLDDDVLCPATCNFLTQQSAEPINSISTERINSVTVVDETASSGDEIALELLNVATIQEAVEGSDVSISPQKDLCQDRRDVDSESVSNFDHDVTLSEEEALYELLNNTVVEGDDLGEELVKHTVKTKESTVKDESPTRDATTAKLKQFGTTEGAIKTRDNLKKDVRPVDVSSLSLLASYKDSSTTRFQQIGITEERVKTFEYLRKKGIEPVDISSPSLLANWGRETPASGVQLVHGHENQMGMDNAEVGNKESEIVKVNQRSCEEEQEGQMRSSLPANASSPSLLEFCGEEAVEQLADDHGRVEESVDGKVHMETTSTTSLLKNDEVSTTPLPIEPTAVSTSSSSFGKDLRAIMSEIRGNHVVQHYSVPSPQDVPPLISPLPNSGTNINPSGCVEVQEHTSLPEDVPQTNTGKELGVQVTISEDKHSASPYFEGQKKQNKTDSPNVDDQKKLNTGGNRRKSQMTLSQWFKDAQDAGSSKQPTKTEQHSKPVTVVELSSSEDESFRPDPSSTTKVSPERGQDDAPLLRKVLLDGDKPPEQKKTVPEERVETQLQFWFGGVKVFFPCKPYKPQRAIMSTVAQSCRLGQFALLESPTGTGKTLALLCAALAWQTAEKAAIAQRLATLQAAFERQEELRWQEAAIAAAATNNVAVGLGQGGMFDIQLQNQQLNVQGRPGPRFTLQVDTGEENANEEIPPWELDAMQQEQPLGTRSNMKCPKIFYGTRTHMQIKHVVSELRKTAYRDVRMCVLASREQFCIHEAANDRQFQSKTELCRQLLEEETVKVNGAMGTGCSYCDNVGVIKTHDNLSRLGCPTPMDIEDLVDIGRKKGACPYFASRSLIATADLIICPYNYLLEPAVRDSMQLNLKGEIVILDEAHNIEDITREAGSASFNMLSVIKAKKDCSTCAVNNPRYTPLAEFLNSFVTWFTSQTFSQRDDFGKETLILPGAKAIASLSLHKIDEQRIVQLKNQLGDIVEEIRQRREERKERRQRKSKKIPVSFSPNTRQLLESVIRVLQYVYGGNLMHLEDYDFVLTRDKHQRMPKGLDDADLRTGSLWQCNLDIWCHNSAVVFSELSSVVRSLLLSSGTLSPMHSFSSELGVSFTNALRGQHIVDSSQVFVKSVSKGPRGSLLSSEYKHARNLNYQDDLGELLLGICQRVPQGVLCFFSSYKFMELITTRWQQTGLWERLSQYKRIFLEPRTSAELGPVITEYYECTAAGALMMAIMRGKISEGFDFADGRARAVVVVGIPYPSVKDPQVTLKQKYNNVHAQLQSGRQWYTTQAYRALNQALGRCIRHIGDWGAMILADHRFEKEKDHARISQWLLDQLGHYHTSRELMENLHSFIKLRTSVQ